MASQFKIYQEGKEIKALYVNVSGSPTFISINVVDEDGTYRYAKSVLKFGIEFNSGDNCVGTTLDVEYSNLENQPVSIKVDGIFGSRTIEGTSIPIEVLGCDGNYELPIYILYGTNLSDSTYTYTVRVV